MSIKLADNIIALRKQNGFSQEEFAEKIGVSRQAVSSWERGIATPDVETLNALAKLFDVDLSSLINGESFERKKSKDTAPGELSIKRNSVPQSTLNGKRIHAETTASCHTVGNII